MTTKTQARKTDGERAVPQRMPKVSTSKSRAPKSPPLKPGATKTPPYRITDYPMHYFAAIQRQNQLNLARALRDFGLSVPMWRALAALHQKDGQTIGEIAQLAVLDRSSLGRLLDDMAKEGLVEREKLPDDRRALAIRLSAAGRRTFEASLPLAQHHYRNVLKGVSPEEFETLMRVLRRIKANTRMMSDVADLEIE
jgi:DNA-binding MarR family transcriptional regulator